LNDPDATSPPEEGATGACAPVEEAAIGSEVEAFDKPEAPWNTPLATVVPGCSADVLTLLLADDSDSPEVIDCDLVTVDFVRSIAELIASLATAMDLSWLSVAVCDAVGDIRSDDVFISWEFDSRLEMTSWSAVELEFLCTPLT
jgi:hypothetical protein